MPIRLIDPSVPTQWVHPSEKGNKDATVFHVVGMTEGAARILRAQYMTGPIISAEQVNAMKSASFAQCVKRIDNVILPGESVARTIDKPEDIQKFVNCLPVALAQEIYEAINNIADLDAGTIKNSEGSHASPRS